MCVAAGLWPAKEKTMGRIIEEQIRYAIKDGSFYLKDNYPAGKWFSTIDHATLWVSQAAAENKHSALNDKREGKVVKVTILIEDAK